MIHQHLEDNLDWRLPWADYKNGFGSIEGSFWLGLEKMHLLTSSQPYRLRVEVQQEGSNLWFSAEYWIFTVGDEASEYRLYVDGYSGDASPEWLASVHSGMNFTTYDQDNDLDYFSNCAVAWDGGWWHNVCFKICLTCGWSSHFWASLPNGEVIDASRMMIQPQPV